MRCKILCIAIWEDHMLDYISNCYYQFLSSDVQSLGFCLLLLLSFELNFALLYIRTKHDDCTTTCELSPSFLSLNLLHSCQAQLPEVIRLLSVRVLCWKEEVLCWCFSVSECSKTFLVTPILKSNRNVTVITFFLQGMKNFTCNDLRVIFLRLFPAWWSSPGLIVIGKVAVLVTCATSQLLLPPSFGIGNWTPLLFSHQLLHGEQDLPSLFG